MSKTIDARGKACPRPVVMTKHVLESLGEGVVTTIVDNPTARDNVERFAMSQGCTVSARQKGDDYYLDILKGNPSEARVEPRENERARTSKPKVVVYVNSDLMGTGEEELGKILMRAFFKTLKDVSPKPEKVIFINSGVKLTTEGSDTIESIRELEAMNIAVLSCGTCLDYYRLKDKLEVGLVTNMFDIASSLMEADRVIRP
ncbi:MAG: sulfurtransferase-like selenium metabolism protein YedF [Thermodesulfobacteriota bacterium]